ncbi:MAG TPA: type VII secretion protein EccE [Jatrophihabitans sp.]|nr:type VII secretion protein EccE [Jatrophihabitans sp.]
MSSPAVGYGRPATGGATSRGGLARRTRALIVAAEAALAAIVGGVVIGGVLGWAVVGVAVVVIAVAALLARSSWAAGRAPDTGAADLVTRLRVQGVPSRSSGDVGVVSDGQGFAAGLELDVAKGALLDVAALCAVAADDPSRPSIVQLRLTTYAPPGAGAPRRARGPSMAVHRRVHVLLRLEPTWASDVVASHGGGAQGSRAALVAALDRIAARLRRAGIANRVLDTGALNALLTEDTAPELRARVFTVDLGARADLDRLIGLVHRIAPERAIVSVCVDLASSDQWRSFAAVLIGGRDPYHTDAAGAAVLADPCVVGVAPATALATVLPLGGGPGDLTPVLTLARG